jgi:hypothetical protein
VCFSDYVKLKLQTHEMRTWDGVGTEGWVERAFSEEKLDRFKIGLTQKTGTILWKTLS